MSTPRPGAPDGKTAPSSRQPLASLLLGGLGALAIISCTGCSAAVSQRSISPANHRTAVATVMPSALRTAIMGMERATNFSFDATVVASHSTTRLIGQFEAPDREHLVLTPSRGSSSELLFIGSKTYIRSASGAWQDALGGIQGSSNPRGAFGALAGSLCGPASLPGGSPGTRYSCTLTARQASTIVRGSAANSPVRCSVTVSGASISDLKLRGKNFDAEIGYMNVGTTPPIPQPA